MINLYLIVKNLTRDKPHLLLNTFAILVAFFLFGVLGSVNKALHAGLELSENNRLVVFNKISFTQPLPLGHIEKIRALDGVKQATHANWFGAYVQGSQTYFAGFAVDPETYLEVHADSFLVDTTRKLAWQRNRQGVLVGEKLAQTFAWNIGDRIPISSNIFYKADGSQVWDMVVEGIFSAADSQTDTNFLLFHYQYFIETQTFGSDWIGWVVLTTVDPALNEDIINKIDDQFANSFYETETTSERQFNKAFLQQFGNIGFIVTSVVAAAFFTLLLIVGNSMALAVRERTQEIAVYKTLGFSAQKIFSLVLSESVLLAALGGFAGLALAHMFVGGMSQSPQIRAIFPGLSLSRSIFLQAVFYMIALGFITGFVPAYRAMQLNIVNGLTRR